MEGAIKGLPVERIHSELVRLCLEQEEFMIEEQRTAVCQLLNEITGLQIENPELGEAVLKCFQIFAEQYRAAADNMPLEFEYSVYKHRQTKGGEESDD